MQKLSQKQGSQSNDFFFCMFLLVCNYFVYNEYMRYFEGYKFKTVMAILAKFVEAIFELIIPLFMARLIDEGIANQDMNIVYSSVVWMLVLTLAGYISALVCQYYASHISQIVGGRIRSDLMVHNLKLSTDQVETFSSSVLTNRITTDVLFIQDMIARVIRLGVRAPFLMIGSLGAMLIINRRLALILTLSLPIFTIVIVGFMFASMRGHERASKMLDKVAMRINELLSGSRIIRAFSKQRHSDRIFQRDNKDLYVKQAKVGIITTLSSPLTTFMMNALMAFLIYISGFEIQNGSMTQGQTIAVINYCNQLVLTLIVSMNLIMIISRGFTSLKRVREIFNTEPRINESGHESVGDGFELEFKDVSFSYPGQNRRVLKDINFVLKEGKTLGIMGLTGSGKSTLVQLIPRFMESTNGTILINHKSIHDVDITELRDMIGYVSQSAQFIKGTLQDNIEMNRYFGAKEALVDAQGEDILNKGIDSIVEESGKNLSGGQKQRVNIARALVKKPKILIFDDSFSALDALTTKKLQNILASKYDSCSQIIVSQRTRNLMHADHIIVLENGVIAHQGTHKMLLKTSDVYAKVYALQNEGGTHS